MGQRTSLGNTILVEHGITTERGDLRAHVGVLSGHVYVFSLEKARRLLDSNRYSLRDVITYINNTPIVTAQGYLVPLDDLSPVAVPAQDIITAANFPDEKKGSTSEKGLCAQNVVAGLLHRGRFPLPTHPLIVRDLDLQRSGFDLIVKGSWHIEIKCDWRAGKRTPNAPQLTGNLFLQTHECNPLRQY